MKRSNLCIAGLLTLAVFSTSLPAHDQDSWLGTWQSSPTALTTTATNTGSFTYPPPIMLQGTVRYHLRISQGGNQVRIRLSNEYGETPLVIGGVSVGLAGKNLVALPGTLKPATFAGNRTITLPPGAPALTDPIDLPVKSLSDLVVSVYLPEGVAILAWDAEPTFPFQLVSDSDATLIEKMLSPKKMMLTRSIVSAIDVLADSPLSVVVALGDSITDGMTDLASGEKGWPGVLSRRLESQGVSVVNAGIGGNQLLKSSALAGRAALARLDQDVFAVPGLSHIIVLEGINDIGGSGRGDDNPLVQPAELIAAYSQIITRAHERGIKVIGATILPFEGAVYYSKEKEGIRQAVNQWIRTAKQFDGVIDFDAVMRDPSQPSQLKEGFHIGDYIHPSHSGYRAMGKAVNLQLFN